jgi:Cu+-exporting ATPase
MEQSPAMDDRPTPAAAPMPESVPVKAALLYTCPMHPQIREAKPGNCPICGMTLEPVATTADVGPSQELVDMARRFWIGLALTLPVFVLEMGGHIPGLGLHDLVPERISVWIQFVLSTPVVCGQGGHSSSAPGRRFYTAA